VCYIFVAYAGIFVWLFVSLLWCAGSSAKLVFGGSVALRLSRLPPVCFLLLWLGQFSV